MLQPDFEAQADDPPEPGGGAERKADGAEDAPRPVPRAPAGHHDDVPGDGVEVQAVDDDPAAAAQPAEPATAKPVAAVPGTDDGVLTRRQRIVGVLLEAATAVGVIVVFLAACSRIRHDPLNRVSQVSAMAKINLRFVLLGLAIIGATLVIDRLGRPLLRRYARQMACAGIAALSTSLVAGGIMFALNGTPYGILAGGSDFGWIADWIDQYQHTGSFPAHYPPIPIYVIWAAVEISGQPVAIVTKPLEIIGTAMFGPVAYFSWRLLLKPIWALTIGVIAMAPFIEPFKMYPHLALLVFVPVMVKLFTFVRRGDRLTTKSAIGWGVGYGLVLAVLFLIYSGWFVWALPGAVLTFALVAPWRTAAKRVLLFAATAAAVFLPLTWVHMAGLLAPTGAVNDNFQYFDTRADPAYIAMWRNDSGGNVGPAWPPLGELGNVGLFSVLLAVGLALALALGWRRTVVITAVAGIAGAWVLRFYLAGEMYETSTVKLYPRTTMFILYLLLILIGFAIYYATDRIRELFAGRAATPGDAQSDATREAPASAGRAPFGLMLAPLLMLFLFTGSATVDRLMPADKPGTDATAIWISHTTFLPDGTCPKWGRGRCVPPNRPAG
jgi:galactan 5-O-arabinofuranosyltransferase